MLIVWAFTIIPHVSAGRSLLAAAADGQQRAASSSACAQLQGGSDPCFPGKCQGKSSSEFTCTCPPGYKVAASNKKCDADPCASVDWESVDACVFANAQLSVTCKSGFNSYNSNSKKCRDIDECDGFDRATVASCTNSKGSYAVICKPGFHDYDTNNIDECDGFDRATVASCTNSKGSYAVICKPGFHDYDTNSKTCTVAPSPPPPPSPSPPPSPPPPPPPSPPPPSPPPPSPVAAASSPHAPPPSTTFSFRVFGGFVCMTVPPSGGPMYWGGCFSGASAWQNFMVEDTDTPNQYVIKLAADPTLSLNYSGNLDDGPAKVVLSSDAASMRAWTMTSR
ncbi:hypothetical protein CHLRE_09g406432v5 [Chlamydomonas reinhardtii]|uniref:EGF-like domain-containing protein n=1 Tax=Chlamydomonas reinhardtii TaxID=3055 RepID=A0A2K3DFA1_CHLRE|nr:uncharacterized protein CHLRE_09g406432v5 [Chlamydomonas reinhardtii]PNW79214.1 hypothetical protein CHLRE_09g406432v5 [Chlamydomonas reinhardtii]